MNIIRNFSLIGVSFLLALTFGIQSAHAWNRLTATTFATLPEGSANPEALAIDKNGQVYVSSFGDGKLNVFAKNGKHIRTIEVTPSSGLLLDLAFHPDTGALIVVDFGAGDLLEVDPHTGAATIIADVPGASPGINALTFDGVGNIYVSDSFQGTIWRTGPHGGAIIAWVQDVLLSTTGFPGFGANGMDFNSDETAFFVANTGDDTIVRVPVDNAGNAGTPEVLVNGISGADGLMVDEDDNIWVTANMNNEIQVLDSTGKAIAVLGDFDGITKKGTVAGLLFPADLQRHGQFLYVTNFALDLRNLGAVQTTISQWAAMVKRHTIARIPFKIPPLPASCDHDQGNDDEQYDKDGWTMRKVRVCDEKIYDND